MFFTLLFKPIVLVTKLIFKDIYLFFQIVSNMPLNVRFLLFNIFMNTFNMFL